MTYGSRKWRPWVLDEAESRPFLRRALELGINFFDTADMYSLGASEEVLGRALAISDRVVTGSSSRQRYSSPWATTQTRGASRASTSDMR